MNETILILCDDCADKIGGACAGPEMAWRRANPGETCGAEDCESKLTADQSAKTVSDAKIAAEVFWSLRAHRTPRQLRQAVRILRMPWCSVRLWNALVAAWLNDMGDGRRLPHMSAAWLAS